MGCKNMKNNDYATGIKSVVASFKVEGINPSKKALDYCELRAKGKVNCNKEVENLKKKYSSMGKGI